MSSLLAVICADFTTQLATEISVGGTTATLSSATDDDGVALPAGRYFFTIDGANSSKEHISCTLSGTSLTSIKSVSRQGVETSGVARKHRIGASVTITDFAHILQINNLLNGTTDLNASTPLEYDGTATISSANQLATKDYVDGVAIAGSPDASTTVKGISKLSTAPVSASNPIAVGDNDGRVPTQSENDALVGTSGTPSSSNKYVTNDDTTGTGSIIRNSAMISSEFGNGADGALTYDGSATVLGMAPSSSIYTLTRDIYGTTITVNNGVTIETGGYRIFASTSLTNNGTIKRTPNNGGNASADTAGSGGAALSTGTIYGGLAGQTGASGINHGGGAAFAGTNGINGTAQTASVGVSGVAGGNGGNAGGGGSTGGTAGTATASTQGVNNVVFATSMFDFSVSALIKSSGGSGSGGSGGGSSSPGISGGGGGSGSTGGIVWISARVLTNSGTISANGGNGGNGANATGFDGGGGGGAGGSGGVVVLIYKTITLGTVSVTGGIGGTAGTGGSGGTNGATGTTGTIIQIAC